MAKSVYRPSIPRWLSICSQNYVGLLTLLPDLDTENLSYAFDASNNQYTITVVECTRYTTTLQCEQSNRDLPTYLKANMTVRLYHDAQVAEVLSWQESARLEAKYPYPNAQMHQPNERELSDRFLAEWIGFCKKCQRSSFSE